MPKDNHVCTYDLALAQKENETQTEAGGGKIKCEGMVIVAREWNPNPVEDKGGTKNDRAPKQTLPPPCPTVPGTAFAEPIVMQPQPIPGVPKPIVMQSPTSLATAAPAQTKIGFVQEEFQDSTFKEVSGKERDWG